MKKTSKLLIVVIVLFAVDFLLTLYFLNTSSHADEANPLINVGNGSIILVINLIYFVVVFILSKIIYNYNTIIIKSKNTSHYFKKLYQSHHFSFIFISLAFAFVYASIVSRLFTIADWIVFAFTQSNYYSSFYAKLRNLMPFKRFDITFSILSMFIFLPIWYTLQFKKSKNSFSETINDIDNFYQSFINKNPKYLNKEYDVWSYGMDADNLALLTFKQIKTATTSLFDLYQLNNEKIPTAGDISIILDSTKTIPVCVIENTNVNIVPFNKVSKKHAYKEGEGDKSLDYWQKIHHDFFTDLTNSTTINFTYDSLIVLEEFKVIYKNDIQSILNNKTSNTH